MSYIDEEEEEEEEVSDFDEEEVVGDMDVGDIDEEEETSSDSDGDGCGIDIYRPMSIADQTKFDDVLPPRILPVKTPRKQMPFKWVNEMTLI